MGLQQDGLLRMAFVAGVRPTGLAGTDLSAADAAELRRSPPTGAAVEIIACPADRLSRRQTGHAPVMLMK